jgi:hypothetical protein
MKISLDSGFPDDAADKIRSSSESAKRRGGRPKQIDEGQLFNRRDQFIEVLCATWGEIGWELTVARTQEGLRDAFSRLKLHAHEDLLAPFVRSTTVQATASEIRATKEKRGQAVRRMYELMPVLETATRRMQQSGATVSQNSNSQRLGPLLDEHLVRLAEFRKSSREMDRVNRDLKSLDTLIADQEASYAQMELLTFVSYAKYAHTPRNLAQAMAGLPHIGCWHSFQQCEKEPSSLWPMRPDEIPPLSYRVFLIIQQCWIGKSRENNRPLVDLLRERIRVLPPTSDLRAELRREVRYLRQAVEETDLAHSPSGEVPHLIFSAFISNKGKPRSLEESALAEIEERQI